MYVLRCMCVRIVYIYICIFTLLLLLLLCICMYITIYYVCTHYIYYIHIGTCVYTSVCCSRPTHLNSHPSTHPLTSPPISTYLAAYQPTRLANCHLSSSLATLISNNCLFSCLSIHPSTFPSI